MQNKIRNYASWAAIAIVLLLILVRLLLSPLTESEINNWFADHGIESTIEDISFDLSSGELSLTGLHAVKNQSRALKLDQLNLVWSWSALFDREFRVESIQVSGLALEVERRADGRLVFAAIELAQESQEEARAGEAPPQWKITLGDTDFKDFEICFRQPPSHDYCESFELLQWKGSLSLDLSKLADDALPLQVQGDFTLNQLQLQNNRLQRRMIGLDRFNIRGVAIDSLDSIAIDSIVLDGLSMLEKSADAEATDITGIEQLQVDSLGFTQLNRLEIGSAVITNQRGRLVKRDDKELELDEWLEQYQASSTTDSDAESGETAEFSFAIDRLEYRTDHSLQYVDQSLSSTFVIDINQISLVIEDLDSRETRQASNISYEATVGKHGKVQIAGTATPLAAKPRLDMRGSITGLDLPELSAFSANAIGHKIKSGQLDAEIELKAIDAVLDSKIDLKLDHLVLSAVSEADAEKVDNQLGFPLNTSLSLLKDRDDLIELSIPITGDINSPDFDPTDAITTATSSAITTAILHYYTPFGLVTLADGLFSLATALRFDPVVFDAGSAELGNVDTAGLEKMITLMQERPGVRVTLCAYTNTEDRKLALPETVEIPIEELTLVDEQMAVLETLGETRHDQVEDFLVARNVDPARLIACETEHVEGEGLAGVEISI